MGKQAKGTVQTGLLVKVKKESVPTAAAMGSRALSSVTSSTTASTSAKATTSSSAKPNSRVAKETSTSGTKKNAIPQLSGMVPLPLAPTSKLRELSDGRTSDNSPGKSVSDRTRRKTNGNEITEEEWKFVKIKLVKVKDALSHTKVPGGAPDKNKKSLEEYVQQFEKAMETGKWTDLPKILQSQWEEEQRGMQNQALVKAKTQPKVEEPKTVMPSSASTSTTTAIPIAKTSLPKEKDVIVQEQKEEKKKEKAGNGKPNIMEIPSDGESSLDLEIVEPDAEMEVEVAPVAVNVDPTAMEGETGEVEEGQQSEQLAMETSVPTPDHTYSTTMSSPKSTPDPIYSTATKISVPPNLVPISDAMTDTLSCALGIRPHPVSLQQSAAQTTTSVQGPISSPVVNPYPTFNPQLDVADIEFLQKKLGESKVRLGTVLTNAIGENPYVKIVSVLEQSLREGSGIALTEPLRTQLQTNSENRFTVGSRQVIVPKSFGLLSPSSSTGSLAIAIVVSTVPSTTSADVAVSLSMPTTQADR